ncbi:MAG: hypothetical protein WCE46_06305 [Methanoregula sp.]|jgi:uncharacterized coiled-coil DUF342 family protein|uniref:hypothetical protein n=1 Tax=Methanoregula sp. TaxID=2052170 RepID=UPI003C71D79D
MDSPLFEHLGRFLERIKNVGFFERLFSWRTIVSLSYDAYGDYQKVQDTLRKTDQDISDLTGKIRDLSKDLEIQKQNFGQAQTDLAREQGRVQSLSDKVGEKESERAKLETRLSETITKTDETILRLKGELIDLKSKNEDLTRRIGERENEVGGLRESERKNSENIQNKKEEIASLTTKIDQLNRQFTEAKETIAKFSENEEERTRIYDARVTEINALKKQLDDDRLRVQAERDAEIHRQYEAMEQTWRKHEEVVEQSLRSICQRHTLEYCDKEKFPVAGKKPDNAILICDQYVIFDAKSPKNSEDLSNFPLYIRNQAEAAKKYAKEENVKKEIFLVVPANTVEYLDEFHLDMADYQVYVVTYDSLEPIILALRKIEDYQFVDQLSPEDRENICNVIGKFAHATKRRMQIDTYFFNEFLGLLRSCESLPEDILKKVVEFEKAEKMNPPMEKRKKLIPTKDLEHEVKSITKKAEAYEIDVTAVTKEKIETIPLDKYLE